ncbi:hypothetical protein NC651_018635 [Populus alba x Populus x berolinensis]|nr:hypothetical protein NC651_018635 [Populus alba x Populus x berolinensis]
MSERSTPTSAGKGYGLPTSASFAKHPLPRGQTKNKILLWVLQFLSASSSSEK